MVNNPTITIISPTPGSVNNSNTSAIIAEIDDGYGSGVSLTSIQVTINGLYAIQNGVIQSGYTGAINVITLTRVTLSIAQSQPYNNLQSVNVSISATDVANNPASTVVFSFITEDHTPAIILHANPAPEQTQVPATASISFDIRKTPVQTKIDINTLFVSVSGIARDNNGDILFDGYGNPVETVFIQPQFGTLSYDSSQVVITPDADDLGYSVVIVPVNLMPLSSTVTVKILVDDLAGNHTNTIYSFATIDSTPPYLINQIPFPNSVANSIASPVSFTIGDGGAKFLGSGVDLSTLKVVIDGELAVEFGTVQTSFVGVILQNKLVNGYDITLTRSELFAPRKFITVEVTVSDFSFNILRSSYIFTTEDITPPQIVNVYPKDSATNIPQDLDIIIDMKSDVAVEELDLNSIQVVINGLPALEQNTFNPLFTGSVSAADSSKLTVVIAPVTPFALGSTVTVMTSVTDVFGNTSSTFITFYVTTLVSLVTTATVAQSGRPAEGIYSKSGASNLFPPVGSFLDVALTANKPNSEIVYTYAHFQVGTDTSDINISNPMIDGYYNPLPGTTVYSNPIRLINTTQTDVHVIRFFAFNTITGEIEDIKSCIAVFTGCPEQDKWIGTTLRDGLEYTNSVTLRSSQFIDNVITNVVNQKIGTANYMHDLGRECFISNLAFDISGVAFFRVRLADTLSALSTAPWLNSYTALAADQDVLLIDGYGPKINIVGNTTHIEGRKLTFGVFNDEAVVEFNHRLPQAFSIQGDMNLNLNLNAVVGGKSFFRLYDDVFNFEVQQYVSKINTSVGNAQLAGQSSFIGEVPIVTVDGYNILGSFGEGYTILGSDGYLQLTDGYKGFVSLFPPPNVITETLDLVSFKSLPVDQVLNLEPDMTNVFSVVSVTPATYNTFVYDANEQQQILFSDIPTQGYFTLQFGLQQTSGIFYSYTNVEVQLALRALTGLQDVVVTGDFASGFTINFVGSSSGTNEPPFQVLNNTLQTFFNPVVVTTQTTVEGGVTYSSAQVGTVVYQPIVTNVGVAFAISVADKPLDSTLAEVDSLNLEDSTHVYKSAETDDIFSTSILLEPGDYTFRYQVTDGYTTRLVGNPFTFRTRQNLAGVTTGDMLVVGLQQYSIQSVVRLITDEYAIEFTDIFPFNGAAIPAWSIARAGTTIISGAFTIEVDNPSNAVVGSDATGAISDVVINNTTSVVFQYVSSTAKSVSVLGSFNGFDPTANTLVEQFDPLPIQAMFDLNLNTSYQNSHADFHKVSVRPHIPVIVDRVRFYTGVAASDLQRTRLDLDGIPMTRATYRAVKQSGQQANYTSRVSAQNVVQSQYQEVFGALPDILVVGSTPIGNEEILSSAYLHSSIDDGFIEWQHVQIGTNPNLTLRSTIDVLTRLDSFSGNPRKHIELEIFTLPGLPQFVADFINPAGDPVLKRTNKSGFAAPSNNVTAVYGRRGKLANVPLGINRIVDNGIVNNFFRAIIHNNGQTAKDIYVDVPHIFKIGDAVVAFDGNSTYVRTTIAFVSTDGSGLISCADSVPGTGVLVKDYVLTQDTNNVYVNLEVPNLNIVFYAVIESFIATPTQTIITFENTQQVDPSTLVGGRFTYPLLPTPAKIISAVGINVSNPMLHHLLQIVIDQELLITHPSLGGVIQTFNDTRMVTDYVISKTDGTVAFLNESFVSSGIGTSITYQYIPVPYQVPNQMWQFEVISSNSVVKIRIEPQLYDITLAEIQAFAIDFFNGVNALAPSVVHFTVNDGYDGYVAYDNSHVIDGYQGDFDPSHPNTGSIRLFEIPLSQIIPDGYNLSSTLLTSLTITFSGQQFYAIGEVESIVTTDVVNSKCRIVLNDEELFRSPLPIGSFARYKVLVDKGLILAYFNGVLVLNRPLVFQKPKFQFGATGKIFDDFVVVDFSNVAVQEYFSTSPGLIEEIGRFIEIEGTVVS